MTTFNPTAFTAPTSSVPRALDVLFAPVPPTVNLEFDQGLFRTQPTDFQASLRSAEKSWQETSPGTDTHLRSNPTRQTQTRETRPTYSDDVRYQENQAQSRTDPYSPAAEGSQPPAAAPAATTANKGVAPSPEEGVGRVGAVATSAAGRVTGETPTGPASQPLGANGLPTPAQGSASGELAANLEQNLKQAAGSTGRTGTGQATQGVPGQAAKAEPGLGTGVETSAPGGEFKGNFSDSSGNFSKGAGVPGSTQLGNSLSGKGQTQLTGTLPAGLETMAKANGAGLAEAANGLAAQGAVAGKSGSQMAGGMTPGQLQSQVQSLGNTGPLASTSALNLATAGNIGGVGTASSTAAVGTTPAAARADVVQQVVQKTALLVRNGRPEIRIDLKPESLGSLKLHITTVNQQVQVRIMAQTQVVKEILEGSLNQLKLDLLNHKLDVERFDVTVAGDTARGFGDAKQWTGSPRTGTEEFQGRKQDQDEPEPSDGDTPSREELGTHSPGRVDYFV